MKLYREYLGGDGVAQQKIYGESIEDINRQAIEEKINPVNLQDPYKWSGGQWQLMNQQQPQQPQQGSPPTQQNNTPTFQAQASQSTSGMGRQVFQRGEDLFYSTDNGYQKIKSPEQLKSLSQAGFLDTTKGRVGEGYAQLPGTQMEEQAKEVSKQVFQEGKDLYRETESGVKKIKSPTELKRLSKEGVIDTTIGRTEEGGYASLDEYLPDRGDEIEPTEGVDSLIGGTQSNWDTIFQQAYESGQSVLQNTINSLKEQQSAMLEEQRQLYEQQAQEAQTALEGAKNVDYGQELGDKLRKKYDLDKKLNQLGEIGNQMAELQSAYNESVQQTRESGITIGQSRGELARKQQEYSQKVSVLKARAGVISDQYQLANDVVETYYNSAERERDRQITRYQELLDNAKDIGLKITEANRATIQDRIDTLTAKQEEQAANRDAIKALATDPNTAEAFYMSGASLDDSYEEVVNKMQPYLGQIAQTERLVSTKPTEPTEPSQNLIAPAKINGDTVDLGTKSGIQQAINAGQNVSQIRSFLDKNYPSITTSTINNLLEDFEKEASRNINRDTIIESFGIENLKETAKDAGYYTGYLGIGPVSEQDVNDYIKNDLMPYVTSLRNQGLSDEKIWSQLTE